jgi:hypothetical protein
MTGSHRALVHGAIAGAVAATVIVVWFFIVDVTRGSPLHTPAFLASVLFGLERVDFGAGLIAAYTALHYEVFVAVGVAAGWFFERTGTPPALLIGPVIGFLLFNLVFYFSVVFTGVQVVRALGWPEVLVGNLLAGTAIVWYLRIAGVGPSISLRATLREHDVVRRGLIAGAIGATAVAVWFLVIDVIQGQPLFTPGALGSVLFHGARDVAQLRVDAPTIIGFTALHLAVFAILGIVAEALFRAAERQPPILLGLVLVFVVFQTLFIGLLSIIAVWLLDELMWWSVLVANLVAAAAMGWFFWREHPKLHENGGRELEEMNV